MYVQESVFQEVIGLGAGVDGGMAAMYSLLTASEQAYVPRSRPWTLLPVHASAALGAACIRRRCSLRRCCSLDRLSAGTGERMIMHERLQQLRRARIWAGGARPELAPRRLELRRRRRTPPRAFQPVSIHPCRPHCPRAGLRSRSGRSRAWSLPPPHGNNTTALGRCSACWRTGRNVASPHRTPTRQCRQGRRPQQAEYWRQRSRPCAAFSARAGAAWPALAGHSRQRRAARGRFAEANAGACKAAEAAEEAEATGKPEAAASCR
jgi:hypothetical protein